jgi:hypothetical protein
MFGFGAESLIDIASIFVLIMQKYKYDNSYRASLYNI